MPRGRSGVCRGVPADGQLALSRRQWMRDGQSRSASSSCSYRTHARDRAGDTQRHQRRLYPSALTLHPRAVPPPHTVLAFPLHYPTSRHRLHHPPICRLSCSSEVIPSPFPSFVSIQWSLTLFPSIHLLSLTIAQRTTMHARPEYSAMQRTQNLVASLALSLRSVRKRAPSEEL